MFVGAKEGLETNTGDCAPVTLQMVLSFCLQGGNQVGVLGAEWVLELLPRKTSTPSRRCIQGRGTVLVRQYQ